MNEELKRRCVSRVGARLDVHGGAAHAVEHEARAGAALALEQRMRMRSFAFLAAAVSVTACGPVVWHEPIGKPARPMWPKRPEEVVVITQKPDRPFVEVALLRAQESDYDLSRGTLVQKLRAHAAKMGCDGVVLVGATQTGELFARDERRDALLATCIQFTTTAGR